MDEIAIKVSHVSKVYRLYDKPTLRFKEAFSISKKHYVKDLHALNDISFEVKKGEMLGKPLKVGTAPLSLINSSATLSSSLVVTPGFINLATSARVLPTSRLL